VSTEPQSLWPICDEVSLEPAACCGRLNDRSALGDYEVEYAGPDATWPPGLREQVDCEQVGASLTAAFRAETEDVDEVLASETEVDIQFHVRRTPQSAGSAMLAERNSEVLSISEPKDVLVLRKADAHLFITAQCALARETYRQVVGDLFWKNRKRFSVSCRYVSRPLVERGAAALGCHGIAELGRVVLRQVRFEMAGKMDSINWQGFDLSKELDAPLGQFLRRHRHIVAFRLDLVRAREVMTADVRVPHMIRYSRLAPREFVANYLLAAGFQLPAADGVDG
jgi:hypothetical protein